jgi:hypothetical protein
MKREFEKAAGAPPVPESPPEAAEPPKQAAAG